MKPILAKLWSGESLRGEWDVSLKIDGVRAIVKRGSAISKNGKPLYNLSHLKDGDYEIFYGNWEKSITATRTKKGKPVHLKNVYSLNPLDFRLYIDTITNPTATQIKRLLKKYVKEGHEGLVLRQGNKWLKVKPKDTTDIAIIGKIKGKGKYEGMLGAFVTEKGNVGTGLSDEQRRKLLRLPIGTVIEVDSMGFTPTGKFRHPRFVRVRYDK